MINMTWAREHRKPLLIGLAILLVAGLAVTGGVAYSAEQTRIAAEAAAAEEEAARVEAAKLAAAERLAEARDNAADRIVKADDILVSAAEYAEPEALAELQAARETLYKIHTSDDATALRIAGSDVDAAIRAVGTAEQAQDRRYLAALASAPDTYFESDDSAIRLGTGAG